MTQSSSGLMPFRGGFVQLHSSSVNMPFAAGKRHVVRRRKAGSRMRTDVVASAFAASKRRYRKGHVLHRKRVGARKMRADVLTAAPKRRRRRRVVFLAQRRPALRADVCIRRRRPAIRR